ncbi:MAG: 6-phosphogluconolactonase [Actinomycetota bacterium]
MELRVATDLPGEATRLFLETAPRTVALSGGSTPRATYEELAKHPAAWERVEVFFGDERCVPPDDPASNFRMADETLLSHVPARAHPMTGCDPESYETELASVFGPGVPAFDLIFLGLGEDGHTASLFPGDPALEVTDRNVVLVERPDHRRMTLTYPVLNAAHLAVFLVSGAAKQQTLLEMLSASGIPAAGVRAERVVVLADPEAVDAA